MSIPKWLQVEHDQVFSFGAFLVSEVTPMIDFDKSSGDNRVQATDRDTSVTIDPYWTYISAVAVAPGSPDVMYVGHNDGRVFKTTNATAATPSWTSLTCASPAYPVFFRQVLRLLVEPGNANVVYVGHGGYSNANLWRLDSSGATTCTSIGSGLPASPVRGIARHPTQATWLYAGTEVGLFASENLGTTWKAASDGPAARTSRSLLPPWTTKPTMTVCADASVVRTDTLESQA